eukprot:8064579-Alexandrium_andersonii.AAC.1
MAAAVGRDGYLLGMPKAYQDLHNKGMVQDSGTSDHAKVRLCECSPHRLSLGHRGARAQRWCKCKQAPTR